MNEKLKAALIGFLIASAIMAVVWALAILWPSDSLCEHLRGTINSTTSTDIHC